MNSWMRALAWAATAMLLVHEAGATQPASARADDQRCLTLVFGALSTRMTDVPDSEFEATLQAAEHYFAPACLPDRATANRWASEYLVRQSEKDQVRNGSRGTATAPSGAHAADENMGDRLDRMYSEALKEFRATCAGFSARIGAAPVLSPPRLKAHRARCEARSQAHEAALAKEHCRIAPENCAAEEKANSAAKDAALQAAQDAAMATGTGPVGVDPKRETDQKGPK